MASSGNGTQSNESAHSDRIFLIYLLFGVTITMLVISLSWNIFCCVSKCCSGKRACRSQKRQSQSPRQMEDNPIYGNLNFMQTIGTALMTEVDGPRSELSSSSLRDQQRVNSNSQSKTQDCYANLSLKPPRPQSGRSSPQVQYSDIIQREVPSESEKEDEGNADAISTMSDLYASVQTQRTKTVNAADTREDYANHL